MNQDRMSRDRSASQLDAMSEPERRELYERARAVGADTTQLQAASAEDLRAAAEREGIALPPLCDPERLRATLLFARSRKLGIGMCRGVLEVSPDGFGFLRSFATSFAPCADDVYVSGGQLSHLGLRNGSLIEGPLRPPRATEQFAALVRVESVNGRSQDQRRELVPFESQAPVLPTQILRLQPDADDLVLRAIARLAPVAYGHRVLLSAHEGNARSSLLARIAAAVRRADERTDVTLCLLDAEPSTVHELRAVADGCNVVAATFDEPPARLIQVAELAIAAAERQAEAGMSCVVVLDSLTALARAGQRERPRPGKLGPADVATHALIRCKRVFAASRQLDRGGSLTLVAAMNPESEFAIEREASVTFANKGNAMVGFDSLDEGSLPCPARTATRSADLPLDRAGRERLAEFRAQFQAASQQQRVAMLRS
jgi:transcription termination factor Rho